MRQSTQEDQIRHCISTAPDDCVLLQAVAERLGILQRKPDDEVAGFARPLVRRMLPTALDEMNALLLQFLLQRGLALHILLLAKRPAIRVAGGDEGTAAGSMRTMDG